MSQTLVSNHCLETEDRDKDDADLTFCPLAASATGASQKQNNTNNKDIEMSKQSNAEEIYAIAKNASGPIKLSELVGMLPGYTKPRGVATRVSSAYWWYHDPNEGGDRVACEMIARSFVDRNGNYAWWL